MNDPRISVIESELAAVRATLRDLLARELPLLMVGTLRIVQIGDVAIGYDSVTGERGFLVRITNGTGSASVKGSLVSASTSADDAAILQANEYDTIGVVAQAGVTAGAVMWIWVTGSICQVLYKDAVAATRGNILLAADTDGRAIDIANPGGGLPGTDTHFKECGHVLESALAGINVLVLAMLHFN